MNIQQYLDRIQYSGKVDYTLAVLNDLQKCHLMNVPFENLDIHYGIPIELDMEKIFTKVVVNRRGGYCYELNGLFFELLVKLGFTAKRISGRVFSDKKKKYGAEFDHLAIIVVAEGREYLTDVGYGEFAFYPLRFDLDIIQEDPRGKFIIERYDEEHFIVSKLTKGEFKPEYVFGEIARELSEFNDMCDYQQSSPDSHFTQKRLISRPTEEGRITIAGDSLTVTNKGVLALQKQFESEADFAIHLDKYFGIHLGT